MANTSENQSLKHITVGLLAHVDTGKTTLAESILYQTGTVRKLGRVDHKDAFLDTYELEKARGITIFSKQAEFSLGDFQVTLLDTPGHVDFSAEMERTLQVLDYAVLLISGADGVQGHVETLWRLLSRYRIPAFLFVNKMDQDGTDKKALLEELRRRLDEGCIDFSEDKNRDEDDFMESLAMCREDILEHYLETGDVTQDEICSLIEERRVFPCYFGSALKLWGVDELLKGLETYMKAPAYPEEFGAKVYKISRDSQNTRLTYMKVTGGSLKVKMLLSGGEGENAWEEKTDQIRIYSGAGFTPVNEASAGTICAVTGLTKTYSGQGLGREKASDMPVLEPVLNYRIMIPEDCDTHQMFLKLSQLEEEEPLLHVVWMEQLGEIHAQVMGEVQIEILKSMIKERFGVDVGFGAGNIVYKETIKNTVEGVGHFEPLRHYAETHLLMEPGEPGSGLLFGTDCSEDILDKNWQRLILTHLEEKRHVGVLTGSEITDMKITLKAGRAHLKHTEGGDFRQATYRAVRQGLMQAECALLEPVYSFRLELPAESVGRAMNDIQRMYGSFKTPEQEGDHMVLTGTVPVVHMQGYQREVLAYTGGRGRLFCSLKGYELCHNEEEVIEAAGYDPELDFDNPTGSVFCSHGAGFVVPWDEVPSYMHLESVLKKERFDQELDSAGELGAGSALGWKKSGKRRENAEPEPGFEKIKASEEELEAIFVRTYGAVDKKRSGFGKTVYRGSGSGGSSEYRSSGTTARPKAVQKEYLLVDGYNIIFAWEELNELAKADMGAARGKLMDILSNYQGFKKTTVILIFDAYRVEGNPGEIYKYHNIYVVFTKEAETADQYIEKTVHEIGKKYRVTVATSDGTEQVIIMGQGAIRMSARDLKTEIQSTNVEIREICGTGPRGTKRYLLDQLSEETAGAVEEIRKGEKEKNGKNS